ncbi:nucleobase-ascorbate transporter 6 isoform X3 [Musa acuminata AAA Group]|uniref:nucleobase-ascorbate transporter 6 isoform X3 n=1 Tax=Musa acuminata AAA Group TaxID=214697 RepID=UPI0031CE9B5B
MAGEGAAAGPKQDDTQPHPVKDQLPDISYCITSPPPWPEAVLLGFQHYLVMLGTTVIIPTALVPQMGGGNDEKARVIQTLLFVAGLNTLLQTTFGTRLPAVIGGSYTFVVPTISIILAARYSTIVDPHQRFLHIMRGTQGALIVSSTIQIILGFSGLWRIVVRLLSPLSAAPLVALAGFGLYEFGFPGVAKCIEIGLPQLIILVIFSQYIPHLLHSKKHVFDRYAVLFSIAIVWLYAFILTVGGAYKHAAAKTQQHCRTDRSGLIASSPWIRVPYPFQWGAPTFNGGEAFAMMAAAFVALVEVCCVRHLSTSLSRICIIQLMSERLAPSPCSRLVLSLRFQGIQVPHQCLLQYLAVELDGRASGYCWMGFLEQRMDPLCLCKAAEINTSMVDMLWPLLIATTSQCSENAGLIALTRVGSRRVVQISAGFMIFFSVLGKFGAVFASIPGPIIAALYCLFFAYVLQVSVSFNSATSTASGQSSSWGSPCLWGYRFLNTSTSTLLLRVMDLRTLAQDGSMIW